MLNRTKGAHAGNKSADGGGYLDVVDDLLGADWYLRTGVLSRRERASGPSPALPEDFSGFNVDAFLDRVSALATQV